MSSSLIPLGYTPAWQAAGPLASPAPGGDRPPVPSLPETLRRLGIELGAAHIELAMMEGTLVDPEASTACTVEEIAIWPASWRREMRFADGSRLSLRLDANILEVSGPIPSGFSYLGEVAFARTRHRALFALRHLAAAARAPQLASFGLTPLGWGGTVTARDGAGEFPMTWGLRGGHNLAVGDSTSFLYLTGFRPSVFGDQPLSQVYAPRGKAREALHARRVELSRAA